jgi:hypothetical protein
LYAGPPPPEEGPGSIIIDPYMPTMQIFDTVYYPIQGQVLDKMGATTGWTYGSVQNTDIDALYEFGYVLNAMSINYYSGPGDSGSPVFFFDEELEAVKLAGIHFARETVSGLRFFSPWGKILVDYPSLDVATDAPESRPLIQ